MNEIVFEFTIWPYEFVFTRFSGWQFRKVVTIGRRHWCFWHPFGFVNKWRTNSPIPPWEVADE